MKHRTATLTALMLAALVMLGACARLSKRAKLIAGNYYIPEVVENVPLMELNKDGSCTLRNVRPGVLIMSVDGWWNVKGDSLIANLDPSTIKVDGDTALVGNIPTHIGYYIVDFNGLNLTLEKTGVDYVYTRRYSNL